ncbi:MAG TPA: hypothetical protein PL056_09570 [bacterium]|nr:hypothetical protein [bacterium]
MKEFLIIFLMAFLWSCTSCNEDKPQIDDLRVDNDVSGSESEEDSLDENSDPDKITDLDNESDDSPDADVDTAVECLDLKIQENVIKTAFPFKDKDGRSTFCRSGCDTPTETDPQCVRNIWEWDNWEKYQKYLAAEKEDPEQTNERECYSWPCELPDMKGSTGGSLVSKCDRRISVNGYRSTMGAVWTHGMSNGVAGMYMTGSGAIEYDPEKDVFVKVGKANGRLSFNKNRSIVLVFDSFAPDNPSYKSFVVSVLKKDGEYNYELIYDNKGHNAFMGNPSFVGENWVLIQICEGDRGPCDVKYSRTDKWEWHSLDIGSVYEGNIVGNKLTFLTPDETADRQIYYCDLSKYPESYKECTKATRKDGTGKYEKGHSPRIDEDNENRLIYYMYEDEGPPTLIEVNYSGENNPEYKEIEVDQYMQPHKVKGNLMMFTGWRGSKIISCWYRFDKQKSYCPVINNEGMEFSTFDGKWWLWRNSIDVQIRDTECYCKEEGICPFEE